MARSLGLAGHIGAYYVAVAWFGGPGVGACINRLALDATVRC